MNIWNVIFALLTGIAFMLILTWLFPMGHLSFLVGLGVGAIWFVAFLIYSSTKKIELSPIHMVVGFGFLFLALFGTVYVATFTVPNDWKVKEIGEPVSTLLRAMGTPSDWLFWPAILYLFIVPFFAIFSIIEGFMNVLEELFKWWRHIIAICMTVITIPIGIFTRIVYALFAALGMYAVGGFGLLFFFAVIAGVISGMGRMGFIRSSEYKELEMEMEYEKTKKKALDMLSTYRLTNPDAGILIVKALREAENLAKDKRFSEAQEKLFNAMKKIKTSP